MFTRRKKIVIGETYLFDVLNETNMGTLTSLVTVVKKLKHNKYVVISVNNGDVFETYDKFLTPYVDPKTASVVRCHYGTTEFNDKDLMYFNYIDTMIDMISNLISEVKCEDSNDLSDIIKFAKEFTTNMKAKVKKYVDISNHQRLISVLFNAYSNIKELCNNKEDIDNIIRESLDNSSEFALYFEKNVDDYIDENIDITKFIENSKNIIEEFYPRYLLVNNNSKLDISQLNEIITNIVENIHEIDGIAIIIGMNDKDEWNIKCIYFDEDSDDEDLINDIKEYVYKLYPTLENDGYCIPKYRFNVITVNKKGDSEEDE